MNYEDYDDAVCNYDWEAENTLAKQRAMLLLCVSQAYFGIIR